MRTLTALAAAFAVSTGLAWLLASRRVTLGRLGEAPPRADRWHERPTPSLGGLAIFAGFAVAVLVTGGSYVKLLAGVGVLFALGVGDDLYGFSPRVKLAGQAIAAGLLVAVDVGVRLPGPVVLAIPATVALLVLASNALNIIDNMDGVTAGVVIVAGGTLALWAGAEGAVLPAAVPAAVVGATAGFAVFNIHPARLFMGDAGSLWLGMAVAALALVEAHAAHGSARQALIPIVLLGVPLLDTGVVVVARAAAGRPIMQGGTDHTAHRLVRLGLGQRGAATALVCLAALCGLCASAVRFSDLPLWLVAPALLAVGFVAFAAFVLRVEPTAGDRPV